MSPLLKHLGRVVYDKCFFFLIDLFIVSCDLLIVGGHCLCFKTGILQFLFLKKIMLRC